MIGEFANITTFHLMKEYNGPSLRNVKTHTAKAPDSVGFPSGGGVVRVLTKKQRKAQQQALARMSKGEVPSYEIKN